MNQFIVVSKVHGSDKLNRAVKHHFNVLKGNPSVEVKLGKFRREFSVDQTLYFSVHVTAVIELYKLKAQTCVQVLELVDASNNVRVGNHVDPNLQVLIIGYLTQDKIHLEVFVVDQKACGCKNAPYLNKFGNATKK